MLQIYISGRSFVSHVSHHFILCYIFHFGTSLKLSEVEAFCTDITLYTTSVLEMFGLVYMQESALCKSVAISFQILVVYYCVVAMSVHCHSVQ